MYAEQSFQARQSELADLVWSWLSPMNDARHVNLTGENRGSLSDNPKLYADTCYGQVLVIHQTYSAGTTLAEVEMDQERTITIAIGHSATWTPIVCVMSSLHDRVIEISNDSNSDMLDAIKLTHDELFRDWPLSDKDIEDFIRENHPEEPE